MCHHDKAALSHPTYSKFNEIFNPKTMKETTQAKPSQAKSSKYKVKKTMTSTPGSTLVCTQHVSSKEEEEEKEENTVEHLMNII